MHLTNKEIFWKCWLWSIISGIIVAGLFWMLSGIGSLFHGENGGNVFLDLLLSLSLLGSYFGAGFVGWRIVDKYYHGAVRRFMKRYLLYSFISFAVLIAIIYSPLSILALLWSVLAPWCVITALNKAKKLHD
jgi:hypothetical protein